MDPREGGGLQRGGDGLLRGDIDELRGSRHDGEQRPDRRVGARGLQRLLARWWLGLAVGAPAEPCHATCRCQDQIVADPVAARPGETEGCHHHMHGVRPPRGTVLAQAAQPRHGPALQDDIGVRRQRVELRRVAHLRPALARVPVRTGRRVEVGARLDPYDIGACAHEQPGALEGEFIGQVEHAQRCRVRVCSHHGSSPYVSAAFAELHDHRGRGGGPPGCSADRTGVPRRVLSPRRPVRGERRSTSARPPGGRCRTTTSAPHRVRCSRLWPAASRDAGPPTPARPAP